MQHKAEKSRKQTETLTVLCDPLDVGGACLNERAEVPRDRAELCFAIRHVGENLLPSGAFSCKGINKQTNK